MAIVKRIDVLDAAFRLGRPLGEEAASKLRKFCTDKLKELGFVTKTFPHEFDFRGYVETKKSVSKIKTVLMKQLLKVAPHITFASSEFLQLRDREGYIINISDSEERDTLPKEFIDEMKSLVGASSNLSVYDVIGSSGYKIRYVNSTPTTKWLVRYCRYLNYIFRKNYIPLVAGIENELIHNVEDYDIARNKRTSTERKASKIRHHIRSSMSIRMCKWSCVDGTSIERFLEISSSKESNLETDRFFGNHNVWTYSYWGNTNETDFPDYYRYSPQKLFMHMDKGVNLFLTISRKVRYAATAYSIGDI